LKHILIGFHKGTAATTFVIVGEFLLEGWTKRLFIVSEVSNVTEICKMIIIKINSSASITINYLPVTHLNLRC
jgi:hypothetical protein